MVERPTSEVVERPESRGSARRTRRTAGFTGYAVITVATPPRLWWLLTWSLVALLAAHDLLTLLRGGSRGRRRWERGLVVKAAVPTALGRILMLVVLILLGATTGWWGILGIFPPTWALIAGFLQRYAPQKAATRTLPETLALAGATFLHRDRAAADVALQRRRPRVMKVLALACLGVLLTLPPAEPAVSQARAPLRAVVALAARRAGLTAGPAQRRLDRKDPKPTPSGTPGVQTTPPATQPPPRPSLESLCGTTQLSASELSLIVADAIEAVWHRLGGELLGCPTGRVDVLGELAVVWFDGPQGEGAVTSTRRGRAVEVLPPFAPFLMAAIADTSLAAVDARSLVPGGEYQLFWNATGSCRLAWRRYYDDPVQLPPSVTVLVLRLAAVTREVAIDIKTADSSTSTTFLLTLVKGDGPPRDVLVEYVASERIARLVDHVNGASTASDTSRCSREEVRSYGKGGDVRNGIRLSTPAHFRDSWRFRGSLFRPEAGRLGSRAAGGRRSGRLDAVADKGGRSTMR